MPSELDFLNSGGLMASTGGQMHLPPLRSQDLMGNNPSAMQFIQAMMMQPGGMPGGLMPMFGTPWAFGTPTGLPMPEFFSGALPPFTPGAAPPPGPAAPAPAPAPAPVRQAESQPDYSNIFGNLRAR